MLEPSTCRLPNDSTEGWTNFTWGLMGILTNPAVAIALVVIIGVVMVLHWDNPQLRRWVVGASLSLMAIVMALPLIGTYALPALIPADSGKPADAIVILGRGSPLHNSRKQVALELFKAGRAPLIFVSGQNDAPMLVDALKADGIPAQQVDGEACSRTTAENGQFTAQLLMPRDVKRIILITDPPHMLRSSLVMRSVGFEVEHAPSPVPRSFGRYRSQVFSARETVGFVAYGLSGRFNGTNSGDGTVLKQVKSHRESGLDL